MAALTTLGVLAVGVVPGILVGVALSLLALIDRISNPPDAVLHIVPGDATATARNITAAPLMYRVGVLSALASDVIFLWLALSLYDLLKDVDRRQARLMVILVTAGSAVALADLINQMAPLVLLSGADFLSPFSKPQLDAFTMAVLRLRSHGMYVAMAFWALWLWPFGVLVIRSGFFPKLLGVLLIVGCVAYLAVSVTSILLPAYSREVSLIAMPFFMIGELSMIVWLLVKGARET